MPSAKGWGVRQNNWEASASIQHQLFQSLSVNVGYARRWFNHFTVTDNRAVTPADYDEFCITAPTDPRLGDVSGSPICGLYDISPAARARRQDNLQTDAANYGEQTEAVEWNRPDADRPPAGPRHGTGRPQQRDAGEQHRGVLCRRLAGGAGPVGANLRATLQHYAPVAEQREVPR